LAVFFFKRAGSHFFLQHRQHGLQKEAKKQSVQE